MSGTIISAGCLVFVVFDTDTPDPTMLSENQGRGKDLFNFQNVICLRYSFYDLCSQINNQICMI